VKQDGSAAGGLAHDGYLVGVAAKKVDVVLDPFKCEALVEEAGIFVAVGADFRPGEESKGAEAVVERDEYHAFVVGFVGGAEETVGLKAGRRMADFRAEGVTGAVDL
jgi:hypothetical protein